MHVCICLPVPVHVEGRGVSWVSYLRHHGYAEQSRLTGQQVPKGPPPRPAAVLSQGEVASLCHSVWALYVRSGD